MKDKINNKLIKNLKNKSYFEKVLSKNFRKKEIEEQKLKNLKISIFVGLITFLTVELYITNLTNSAIFGIIFFCFIFILLSFKPIIEHKRKIKKIESELPFFLVKLVTEIKIGNSFINAIKKNCKEEGVVEDTFKKIINDMESGKSFEESVIELNNSLNSLEIKRALSSLTNIYYQGSGEESLKRLTDELFLKQKIASKEFSGKMVVYSLVFIAISAIVPAMFSSFVLIGSYFMSFEFSALEVLIVIVIVFPILDLAILMLINSKTPLFLKN